MTSVVLTVLPKSLLWSHLSPVAVGIITGAVFYLGVFFIPKKVIALIDARKANRPAPPQPLPSPEPLLSPESVPVQGAKERHRQSNQHALWYILVILILSAALLLSFIIGSSAYRELKRETEIALAEQYDSGHNDGYKRGKSHGLDVGYNNGYKEGREEGRASVEDIHEEYAFYHLYACLVTSEGYRYHKYGCYHIEGRTFWIYNIENAEYRGYTPCLDCW